MSNDATMQAMLAALQQMANQQQEQANQQQEQDWNSKILTTMNKIAPLMDAHVAGFNTSVKTLPNGMIYVDIGRYGNATLEDPETVWIFLEGIVTGMCINRG